MLTAAEFLLLVILSQVSIAGGAVPDDTDGADCAAAEHADETPPFGLTWCFRERESLR
jgi:hypothetical protein